MQQWLDRFCYKHPRLSIPGLMRYIVIGNVLVFLLDLFSTGGYPIATSLLSFSSDAILQGQIWRIITFVFVPATSRNIFLFAITLYFYYFIGSTLEREWGPGRFTIYYLMGMLLTVVYGFVTYFVTGRSYFMTSNYINLSMFFAFATLFPDNRVLVFYIIPVKIKWLALLDALYFVYAIFSDLGRGMGMMSFLPLVALLNYVLFCGDDLFHMVMPNARQSRKKTINFQREVRKIKHEQKNAGYTRKCAVCGRTDTDYPDLEFRYCSRCVGVHCFCQDHINNHVHFTE